MNLIAPNVKNLKRGGAIVLLSVPPWAPGYLDIGNIPDFSFSQPTNILKHQTARSGALITDRQEPTEFSNTFKIAADELNVANMQQILYAQAPTSFSQGAQTGNTYSIVNPVLGSSYPLGTNLDLSVTNVSVTQGGAKTEGTDYSLEKDLGVIRILPTGTINPSGTLTITYDRPALTGDIINPLTNTAGVKGPILIYYRDSGGQLQRFNHTLAEVVFTGDIAIAASAFAKCTAEITVMPDLSLAQNLRFGSWVILTQS